MHDTDARDLIAEEREEIDRVRRHWFQWSHWAIPGHGGAALVAEDIALLRQHGFRIFRGGRVPKGVELIYAPTGSVGGGSRGREAKYWVGRWVRPAKEVVK